MTHSDQLLILALAKSVAHLTDAIFELAEGADKTVAREEAESAREQLAAVAKIMEEEWGAYAKSKSS